MPFQKGNPGGPGRPKIENSLSDLLRKALKEAHTSGVTHEQYIAKRLIEIAEGIDDQIGMNTILKIMDRLEGTPKQTIDAEVTERRPLSYDPVYENQDEPDETPPPSD